MPHRPPTLTMRPDGFNRWLPATANDGRRLAALMARRESQVVRSPVNRGIASLVVLCAQFGVELVFKAPASSPARR
jgi:hypothetical protein